MTPLRPLILAALLPALAGCAGAGIGVAAIDCDVIDVTACSAALVHAPTNDPTLIGRLAGETQAACPRPAKATP